MDDLDNLFDNAVGADEPGENATSETKPQELEDIPLAAVKKKRTLKPQPKLDAKRLMGTRGLEALQNEFDGVDFKGRGHEVEDLDLLLARLEHWAHRLHPRMTFDDCLEKIERLGHKKEIQVCMKKLRMGMPLFDTEGGSTVITGDAPAAEDRDTDDEILNLPMNNNF